MATLKITIPDAKLQDVADAVSGTYGGPATQAGVEQNLKKHLQRTLTDHKRRQASEAVPEASL